MRHLNVRIVVFLCAIALAFVGQDSSLAQTNGTKYWIMFSGRSTMAQGQTLVTDRARRRRALRGDNYPKHIDDPVDPVYLSRLSEHGIAPVHTSRWFNAVSAYLKDDQVPTVRSMSFVKSVSTVPRTVARNFAQSPTPFEIRGLSPRQFEYGSSFKQLSLVNAIGNIEAGINGSGVRFGLIDTGIGDLSHPALAKMISEGRFIESRDFTGFPDDGSRHGLGVLTIATGFAEGSLIGPAFGAEVLHARTEYVPTETRQEEDNLVAALEWMESQGVDVVNISLGYSTFDDPAMNYTYADMNGDTAISTRAVDLAVRLGIVVVSSAGNEGGGSTECSPQTCWYYITSPADADSSITVGATSSEGIKAAFSSFGPTSDGRIKPDVSAMGVFVTFGNSFNSYSAGNGTSFSSPMVAGVVAQMLQVNPDLTPIQVRDILRQTARIPALPDSLQISFPNNRYGWGIIDAGAAVAIATSIDEPEQVPSSAILSTPYPNPATNKVSFDILSNPEFETPEVRIYDILGRETRISGGRDILRSTTRVDINTNTLPVGLYVYRIVIGQRTVTGKFAIVR